MTSAALDDRRAGKPKQRRLAPDLRRAEIIARAAEFFAEEGFERGTRDLAASLGITQPLLYRYFPSKDDLVGEVYSHVYLRRWNPDWEALLTDRSIRLRERLRRFYGAYTETIFTREWIRIYLFAGLKGIDLNRRYIGLVEDRLLRPIVSEFRHEAGAPDREPTPAEIELAWLLHGGIFYHGVRKHVFGSPVLDDQAAMIANALDVFLEGAVRLLARP